MARPKSTVSTTSTDEKITVEAAETKNENETITESKPVETPKENKATKITDDGFVTIQNPKYAYRKVRALVDVYDFDEEGKAKVTGKDAKVFLELPGFAIAK